MFKPVVRRKVNEEVADAILGMIKNGQLKPGDKIDSVVQLAESFDVSRSVIREALSGLRAMGLIVMRQGEGTFVTKFDVSKFHLPVTTAFLMKKEHIKDLFEVRKILEAGSARAAALNYEQADLFAMKAALEEMNTAKGYGKSGEKADVDFHLAVVNASQNDILINLMSSVSELMAESIRETRKLYYTSQVANDNLLNQHELIFNAIKSRDVNQAQKCMLDHLVAIEDLLKKHVY